MKLQKKQIEYIATGILCVLFIFLSIKTISYVKKHKSKRRKNISSNINKTSIDAAKQFSTMQEKIRDNLKNPEWRRDPFFAGKYIKKSSLDKNGNLGQPKLTGIIWDRNKPVAIISDNIVKEKDSIGNFEVEKIYQDKVILFNTKNEKNLILHVE